MGSPTPQWNATEKLFVNAFKFAIQEQKLRYSIIQEVKPLKQLIKKSKTNFKHTILTPVEAKLVLNSLEGNFFKIAYEIAMETGMRRGEILGLKWDSVDLEKGTLVVKETRTQAGGLEVVKDPKSTNGFRNIKLTDKLKEDLIQIKMEYEKNQKKYYKDFTDSQLVICHRDGKKCSINGIDNNLNKLRKKLGIRYFRLHDLRHTALSFMYSQGMDDVQVAKIAGHAKASYTKDTYIGNIYDPAPKASEIMNRMLYTDEFTEIECDEDFEVIDNSIILFEVEQDRKYEDQYDAW